MKPSDPDSSVPQHRSKQVLLPQITTLTRQGFSSREIAERLSLSKTTIGRWLRALRKKSAQTKPLDPAEQIQRRISRHKRTYRRLIRAWRDSKAEKQVRVVEDAGANGSDAASRRKKSIRTESRTSDPRYLFKAIEAQNRIDDLEDRLAALSHAKAAGPDGGATLVTDLSDDDLAGLTADELENFSDEQLFAIANRLRAIDERNGATFERPLTTLEELRATSGEELDNLSRLRETKSS